MKVDNMMVESQNSDVISVNSKKGSLSLSVKEI